LTQSSGKFANQPTVPATPPASATATESLPAPNTSLRIPWLMCSNVLKKTPLKTHSRTVFTPYPR